ncbi:hypothetical protein [Microbacterium sp. NPDC057650]|uniref:hypothetical protein n=1 Tax=unclassified Microbacterium TaxID=2609290 RepID=UPI00366C766D
MAHGSEKQVEPKVMIPEGATPEEEQRLIDEAVAKATDRYVDESIDKLRGGFGK